MPTSYSDKNTSPSTSFGDKNSSPNTGHYDKYFRSGVTWAQLLIPWSFMTVQWDHLQALTFSNKYVSS